MVKKFKVESKRNKRSLRIWFPKWEFYMKGTKLECDEAIKVAFETFGTQYKYRTTEVF